VPLVRVLTSRRFRKELEMDGAPGGREETRSVAERWCAPGSCTIVNQDASESMRQRTIQIAARKKTDGHLQSNHMPEKMRS